MTNMTGASFQYFTCYFIITCAYSGSLFSESHASNQKAQLFLLCFYPALNMMFKIFSLFCVLFYMTLLVQGAGYFSQKFQGPFPVAKFEQIWQMNIGI
jgi:hypothetical protein